MTFLNNDFKAAHVFNIRAIFRGSHFSLQPSGDQKQRIPQPFFCSQSLGTGLPKMTQGA